jgi:creatinine amidohydrolase
MFWEELTSDEFPGAVQAAGEVCLIPLAVLERHAHHLPLGTDKLIARELCRRAAALEPAIVFADYIFTQIFEARTFPGAVAVEPELILRLLEATCQEIARNGLKKIILVSGHGGNHHFTRFFAQTQLGKRRDYAVYVVDPGLLPAEEAQVNAQWETTVDGHAGESETSQILAIRPELVHMERVPATDEGQPKGQLAALAQVEAYTGAWWYGDHPTHYRGDARPASAEKGQRVLDAEARALAAAVRAIKADSETARLQAEFFAAAGGE